MSVSSGIAPCAEGRRPPADTLLREVGSAARSAGGHVRFADRVVRSHAGWASSRASPGGAGTVCAHVGAGFCIGTACFGSVSVSGSAGVSVFAQSGPASFCIGSAGRGSASEAVSGRLHAVVVAHRWCYRNGSRPHRGRLVRRHSRNRRFSRRGFLGFLRLWFQVDGQSSPGISSCIRGSGEYVGQSVLSDRVGLLLRPVGGVRGLAVAFRLDLRRLLSRDPAPLYEPGHVSRDGVVA